MSLLSLILRNLKYYRKPYLAIMAGTVISTAVLTGALVVGDSVRFSLRRLTEIRLGKTRFAIQGGDRFFRQQLANDLAIRSGSIVSPVMQLEGIAVNTEKNLLINRAEVLGIDMNFNDLWKVPAIQLTGEEAILSRNTAENLDLKPGDEFLLKIRKQAKAPADAPFVSEKEPLFVLRLKVTGIAEDIHSGRFSLKSNQTAPFNIFINLDYLSKKAGLAGNANLLLVGENENLNVEKIDSLVRLCWQPEDAGLDFRNVGANNKWEIRSDRIFIDDNTANAIQSGIPGSDPVLTYLVNAISTTGKSTPYSFVSAVSDNFLKQPLAENQIIISDWLASDLHVKSGDSLSLRYFKMGGFRNLTEDSSCFIIKNILPITDPLFDRALMPEFPGMTEAGNCRDWETGAPIVLGKIRDKDEKYWKEYRGTPKALISIASGQRLWDNSFGLATAYRFQADSSSLPAIEAKLMKGLIPSETGLQVQAVYAEGERATANSTDFGGLFLSLSFFIILAALLLIGLLFSLHAQKRMGETAILASIGFRKREIARILLFESLLVAIAGSILGVNSGIFYNKLLLLGLNTLWQDAVRTPMLQMNIQISTLIIGFAVGVVTALLVLLFIILKNLRMPLSVLVKGIQISSVSRNRNLKPLSFWLGLISFGAAVILMIFSFLHPFVDISVPFLSAGGLILVAGICSLNYWLLQAGENTSKSAPGITTMVIQNLNIRRRRTITAVALLAIGTFSVIITGANHKTFYGTENSRQSGTGGFLFWAESTIPIRYDLNLSEGKSKYGLVDEPDFQGVRFVQMHCLDGNDASCLNLNQVSQPSILGVNSGYFDRQQSFSFGKLNEDVDKHHPWLSLDAPLSEDLIPGFADLTVIQWGLRKKIGDTLKYQDERGKLLNVKLMGGLNNSVFQGNILVSDKLFRQYYPSVGGSEAMLVDGPFRKRSEISRRLTYLFQDFGMMVTPASERLAQFYSVENTYLSVFMLLGGLGMIIGTMGLGIVILRNLTEREPEIALYQALGFNYRYVVKLMVAENLIILLAGVGIGVFAAFAGILPSFFSSGYRLPSVFLIIIILSILLSGVAWIVFPIKSALGKNLLQSLRKE